MTRRVRNTAPRRTHSNLGLVLLFGAPAIAGFPPSLAAQTEDGDGAQRPTQEAAQVNFLEQIDFSEPASRHRLAPSLREISGLTTVDGRLFAHDDEQGVVVEIDPKEGDVLKWIYLGPDRVRGDFEGIAWIEGSHFLITSGGTLASFVEGEDGERVPFEATTTALADVCEVEGLTETRSGQLLAVCKTNREKALKDGLQVFALNPSQPGNPPMTFVSYDKAALRSIGLKSGIRPSGIVEVSSGHLLVLDARNRLILELDTAHRPVGWTRLDKDLHRQPEGIAISSEGDLLIADEGGNGRGRLTRYNNRQTNH
ncbi:MAG: SdiA-regulated domain-containing protein [Longimicrobiales bacterium]